MHGDELPEVFLRSARARFLVEIQSDKDAVRSMISSGKKRFMIVIRSGFDSG